MAGGGEGSEGGKGREGGEGREGEEGREGGGKEDRAVLSLCHLAGAVASALCL